MQVCPRTCPNSLTGVGSRQAQGPPYPKPCRIEFNLMLFKACRYKGWAPRPYFRPLHKSTCPRCDKDVAGGSQAERKLLHHLPSKLSSHVHLAHSCSDRTKRLSHGHGKRSCSRCANRPYAGSSQLSQGAPQADQMTQLMHASAAAHRRQPRARPPQGAVAVATPLHPGASAPPPAAAAPPPRPLPRGRPQRLLLRRNLRPRQPRDCTPLWRAGPHPRCAAARCHQSSRRAAWRRDHAVRTPAPARQWRRERLTRWRGGRQGCPAHL